MKNIDTLIPDLNSLQGFHVIARKSSPLLMPAPDEGRISPFPAPCRMLRVKGDSYASIPYRTRTPNLRMRGGKDKKHVSAA